MKVVIYDRSIEDQWEPIAIIDVPWKLIHGMRYEGRSRMFFVRIPEEPEIDRRAPYGNAALKLTVLDFGLEFEPIYRGSSNNIICWNAFPTNAASTRFARLVNHSHSAAKRLADALAFADGGHS